METLKFKTNIRCGGCIAAVTPFLNSDNDISNWQVDLTSPERILTVETGHKAEDLKVLVKKAGYTAEEIA